MNQTIESTDMPLRPLTVAALTLVGLAFVILYWDIGVLLVKDWGGDDNSHGFFIIPIAAYFIWKRRDQLLAEAPRPSNAGLLVVLASAAVLVVSVLGAALFTSRLSMLGMLAGIVLYLFGWRHLRIVAFSLAFLVLMIPIPRILFNQIAFPLQLLASRSAELALGLLGIPVLREGNVISLSTTTLEVADACSGIRSLVSLLTLAIVYGYVLDNRIWARVTIAVAAIPVAIAANAFRVAATGIAAHYIGPEVAQGVLHTFSGWLVFVVAFFLLALIQRTVVWFFPVPAKPEGGQQVA